MCGLIALAILLLPLNMNLGSDYGYFGEESVMQEMGPWPERIPIIVISEFLIFGVLFFPWIAVKRFSRENTQSLT